MFCRCFQSDVSVRVSGLVVSEPALWCLVGFFVLHPVSHFLLNAMTHASLYHFVFPGKDLVMRLGIRFSIAVLIGFVKCI